MSSISESSAAPFYASMYAPAYPRQRFEPELSPTYVDGGNKTRTGKPDYVCHQARTVTFIEHKFGRLNRHLSQDSSHAALQAEYGHHRPQSHSFLSDHFWFNGYPSGKVICVDHGYNHSLFKLLALQAEHGWWNYIVVFAENPKPEDANAYCDMGLVFCTKATAQRLLASIDLWAHGVPYPFAFHTRKYSVTVQPGLELSPAERRATYEAVVVAEIDSIRARATKAAADLAAGCLPF